MERSSIPNDRHEWRARKRQREEAKIQRQAMIKNFGEDFDDELLQYGENYQNMIKKFKPFLHSNLYPFKGTGKDQITASEENAHKVLLNTDKATLYKIESNYSNEMGDDEKLVVIKLKKIPHPLRDYINNTENFGTNKEKIRSASVCNGIPEVNRIPGPRSGSVGTFGPSLRVRNVEEVNAYIEELLRYKQRQTSENIRFE